MCACGAGLCAVWGNVIPSLDSGLFGGLRLCSRRVIVYWSLGGRGARAGNVTWSWEMCVGVAGGV